MKVQIFSVYDSKTQVYGQPNFLLNRGAALRAWEDASNDPQSNIGKHPADYTMFHIGEWDDEEGTFSMLPAKVSLGLALEFVGEKGNSDLRNSNYNNGLHSVEGQQ